MTVRAQQPEVVEGVVPPITVDVVHLERDRLVEPRTQPAPLAAVLP
jgi:hypothetical protein